MEDAEVLKELYETIKQNSKADYAGITELVNENFEGRNSFDPADEVTTLLQL